MIVLVNAVRQERERVAAAAVLGALVRRGHPIHVIAWDRGKVIAFDLEAIGVVHEVESINRWRTPQVLAKVGLRPLARFLRARRVKRWWAAAGTPGLGLLLGPIRPELTHYLPPTTPAVLALVGWRDLEEPESLDTTLALADQVLDAEELGDLAPRLWERARAVTAGDRSELSTRLGIDDATILLVGLGPLDWRGGPDLLLRAVDRLRRDHPGLPLAVAWFGAAPDEMAAGPYTFDAERLGLADLVQWRGDDPEAAELLWRADAVVLTQRAPHEIPFEHLPGDLPDTASLLTALGVPIVGLDLPAARALGGPDATWVPYPDVDGLARALVADLEAPLIDRVRRGAAAIFTGVPA